jgi:hypothetical protein
MALRRSLAQVAQVSIRQSVAPHIAEVDIGSILLRPGPLPPPLHRLAASFTSLRLFGARPHAGGGVVAAETQWNSTRRYTTTSPPDQQAGATLAAAQAPGGAAGDGETLEEIRARIFGTHIGNGLRSGRKVLRTQLLGDKIVAYYPEDPRAKDPLMLSLKAEKWVVPQPIAEHTGVARVDRARVESRC